MAEAADAWTIQRLLEWTAAFLTRKGVDAPRLSAELLLSHVLGLARIALYTNYQRPVSAEQLAVYRELVKRAAEHEPVAYLTGTGHFFGLEFVVTRDVLIPRPDTETLVENLVQWVRREAGLATPRILDLCTGSGCVALAVASQLKGASVMATDISPAAVQVARDNARRHGLAERVTIESGDLFGPLAGIDGAAGFDAIVANPPYIPTEQIKSLDRCVRDYEPLAALDGGPDGLAIHRRILAEAAQHLVPGGRLLLEIAFDQGPLAVELASPLSYLQDVRVLRDHAGKDRVLSARRK